jgi:hypothetical membrane protein
MRISRPAAFSAIAGACAALLLLLSLHVLSPEFSPAWRMVREYGNGSYEWVLSLMFVSWGLSSIALAFAIRSQASTRLGKFGLVFLVIAGVGEVMGGVFDINHDPGHSIAGALGIIGLPIAAVSISVSLGRTELWSPARSLLLWTANLTWASVVLLALTFVVMIATFMNAQGALPTQVPQAIPPGVVALVGWSNRLLVISYCAWVIAVAWQAIRLSGANLPPRSARTTLPSSPG